MVAGRFTLLDQSALDDLLPLAAERGVGVVAAAVYNSGLLSTATVDRSAHYDYGQAPRAVVERALRLAEVCERYGVDLPAAAVQYPLRHPAVVSVVTGMRTGQHVRSTASRYREQIPESLWEELDSSGLAPDPARTD
jgi:D-threo-aldose 1-dehydrogenase